jgi:soluble lytic murein transglycosylase
MRFPPSRRPLAGAVAALLALFAIAAPVLPSAKAAEPLAEREQFRSALVAAARPQADGAWKRLAAALADARYPLAPYVEYTALRARLATLGRAEVEQFLARWPDTLAASDLRNAYLRELARRADWSAFRALYAPAGDRELQCAALQARLAGGARLDYATDLEPLWQGARALPQACAPVLAAARTSGVLDAARVRERLARAVVAGNADAAAQLLPLLDGVDRGNAERLVGALRDPAGTLAKARTWPDEPATREAASHALARYARRDSAAAETAWAEFQTRFKWDDVQKNRVLYALALYRSTSYSSDAMARLDALPAAADDDATREWRVRIALAGGDWAATLAALDRLSEAQQADARWRYLRARVLMKLDRQADAAPLFAGLAHEANFHGFLAADWLDQPYTICATTLSADDAAEAVLARQPDLARAFEFRALDMLPEARREWDFAMAKLDATQRRRAADLAYRRGWYDRAVFAFSADPDTQRLYEQRFPLGMEAQVKRAAAAAGIEPAWAYAIIRAESAWMTDARSHADAYGLMQLLPGVAKPLAKAEGLPYAHPRDLFQPTLNVQLGTRHLGRMAGRYDGSPWLASAAYNAGETPVGRWLDARGTLEPDFFIETIPYKETREYVARVLAFSVIYDWRLNGKARALSARLPKIGQAAPAIDADAPRKPVVCPAAAPPAVAAGS